MMTRREFVQGPIVAGGLAFAAARSAHAQGRTRYADQLTDSSGKYAVAPLPYGNDALEPAIESGLFGDLTLDVVDAVVAEAGRFAGEVIAPLNQIGDKFGTPFKDGAVTTPPGWKEGYRDWAAGGWNGLAAPTQWGGQGLPQALS